VEIDSSP
jgi:hypothetical protein